jgi:hypothetical protein
MLNFKFPFCISLVLWFFFSPYVYMYQCGLGYLCRLENIEVLQRRNWSISTGNWSLVGVRVLMTSNSFTLLCRIVMVLHFTSHIHARTRTHVTRAPNVWEIFLLFYIIIIIILDYLLGERRGRRNQSTSPERAQTKHKMLSFYSSFIFSLIDMLVFWILEVRFFWVSIEHEGQRVQDFDF